MNGVRTLIKFLRPLDNIDFSLGSLKIQLFLSFFFFFSVRSFRSRSPLRLAHRSEFSSLNVKAKSLARGKKYIYIFMWSSTRNFYFLPNNCASLLFPAERSSKAFHHFHRRFVERHRVRNPSPIFDRTINRSTNI